MGSSLTPHTGTRFNRRQLWLIALVFLTGLALALAHAFTKIPHTDEGDLGSAAVSILQRGHMAFPFSYSYLASFREDYLLPPFYFYSLAGWFALAGKSLEAYRTFHVLWWAVLTLCWISSVRSASRSGAAVVIGAALLALNYDTINLGVSRYDVVTAALNAAAVAAYLHWRQAQFSRAIFVANSCLALSAITHPHAIFGLLACVLLVVMTGDWRKVRLRHTALAFAPYAVAFGAWAVLVDGRWTLFLEQMSYGARSKRGFFGNPLQSVMTDLRVRWWELFAGWRAGVPAVMKAKTGFLMLWLVAIGAALSRGDRDEETRVVRALALTAILSGLLLAFIDTVRLQIYVINVIPPAVATLSLMLGKEWEKHRSRRLPTALLVGGLAVFGAAAILYRVRANDLFNRYTTVARLVASNVKSGDVLIAPAEMAYAHGFEADIRSDAALQSIASGKLPAVIVRSIEQGDLSMPRHVPCALGAPPVLDSASYGDITPPSAAESYRIYVRQPTILVADSTQTLVRDCGAPRAHGVGRTLSPLVKPKMEGEA